MAQCQKANGKEETLSTLRKAAEALGGEGWCESERVNVKEAAASFPAAVSFTAAGLKKRKNQHSNLSSSSVPLGWRQFWSKTKLQPYYQHKATKRVVWHIPCSEWEPSELDCVCNKCYTARVSSRETSSLDSPSSPAKDARAQVSVCAEQQLELLQGPTVAASRANDGGSAVEREGTCSAKNGAKRQRVEEEDKDGDFSQDARTNASFANVGRDSDSAPDTPDGDVMRVNVAKQLAAYVAAVGATRTNGDEGVAGCEEDSSEDDVRLVPFSCESPVEARTDSFRRKFSEGKKKLISSAKIDYTPDTALEDSAPESSLTSVCQAQDLGAFVIAATATAAHAARRGSLLGGNLCQPESGETDVTSEDDLQPIRCESTFEARDPEDLPLLLIQVHHQSDPPDAAFAKTPPTVRRRPKRHNLWQPSSVAATKDVFGLPAVSGGAPVSTRILVFEGKNSVSDEISVGVEKKRQETGEVARKKPEEEALKKAEEVTAEQARPWLEEEAEAKMKTVEAAAVERSRLEKDGFRVEEEGRLRREEEGVQERDEEREEGNGLQQEDEAETKKKTEEVAVAAGH